MKYTKKCFFIIVLLSSNLFFSQKNEDRIIIKEKSNISELIALQNKYNSKYLKMLERAKQINVSLFSKGEETGTLSEIVNGIPFYDINDNINAAKTNRVDKIWEDGVSGLNLTGDGITIGHWEASGLPLISHVELSGKIFYQEAGSPSQHATHTAGTMVATGFNSSARGMASSAIIHARRSNNDEAEMASFAASGGILSNHSYSSANPNGNTPLYGYYSNHAKDWDEISYNAPYYLIVKSAGNNRNDNINVTDGGYDVLFSQATAKNILVVGAVDNVPNYTGPSSVNETTFSNYGPTDDWRIKPDVVANGQNIFSTSSTGNNNYYTTSGTSMATPSVTGAVALLQQHYHNKNNVYMKSATVKALIINSTDEVGASSGPDFAFGWGLVNAERAAEIITNNTTTSLLLEESLENNQTFEFTIDVDGTKPLSLTMAWTDVAAIPISSNTLTEDQSDLRLVNDLDVRVLGNDIIYKPWIIESGSFTNSATKGDNFRDNIEKIEIDNIPSGAYTIQVKHKGQLFNSDQDFSIVINNITNYSLSTKDFVSSKLNIFPSVIDNGEIFINANEFLGTNIEVFLYDITGREIKKQAYINNRIVFKVPSSLFGLYILKVKTMFGSETKKIVIK